MSTSEKDGIILIPATIPLIDIQQKFNHAFPYLKVEFYKKGKGNHKEKISLLPLPEDTREIIIKESMTIAELEKLFSERFGIIAKVFRQSIIWMETSLTSSWTLKQQNDHGREISGHGA